MQNDRRTANIDRDALLLIFERVSHILYPSKMRLLMILAP
jgi:hypothetical protein